jgi:hypothetical protein
MAPIQKEDQDMGTDPWLGGNGTFALTTTSRNGPDDVKRAIGKPVAGELAAPVTATTGFGIEGRQR